MSFKITPVKEMLKGVFPSPTKKRLTWVRKNRELTVEELWDIGTAMIMEGKLIRFTMYAGDKTLVDMRV